MVLSLGLTNDIEVRILQIGFNTEDISFSKGQQQQLLELLNADRINYMGEVDASVPLKTVLNIKFNEITAKIIEEMYAQGRFYPDLDYDVEMTKKSKEAPSISF